MSKIFENLKEISVFIYVTKFLKEKSLRKMTKCHLFYK